MPWSEFSIDRILKREKGLYINWTESFDWN